MSSTFTVFVVVTKFLALGDENKNYVFCFALRSLNSTFAMR